MFKQTISLLFANDLFIICSVMSKLDDAVNYFGSKAKLADKLEVTPMAVVQWFKRGVPAKRAVQIEEATKGEVTRHDLRPDIFGENKNVA